MCYSIGDTNRKHKALIILLAPAKVFTTISTSHWRPTVILDQAILKHDLTCTEGNSNLIFAVKVLWASCLLKEKSPEAHSKTYFDSSEEWWKNRSLSLGALPRFPRKKAICQISLYSLPTSKPSALLQKIQVSFRPFPLPERALQTLLELAPSPVAPGY